MLNRSVSPTQLRNETSPVAAMDSGTTETTVEILPAIRERTQLTEEAKRVTRESDGGGDKARVNFG